MRSSTRESGRGRECRSRSRLLRSARRSWGTAPPQPPASSKSKRAAGWRMRRAQAGSNADVAVDRTLHLASAASRVLPPDSARERREQVTAAASVEQHEDDRARQDALRDLEIRVDVDD